MIDPKVAIKIRSTMFLPTSPNLNEREREGEGVIEKLQIRISKYMECASEALLRPHGNYRSSNVSLIE